MAQQPQSAAASGRTGKTTGFNAPVGTAEPETARSRERKLASLAVERGYASAERMQAALQEHRTAGGGEAFGTFLVRAKILTDEQVRAAERALRGASVIGGFEILEKVGQGGMGAVFRARQLSMDRIVALKILPPKLAQNPGFKQRFLNEARTSAKLSHMNIINGIDCGEASGYTYFAMEFVDGKTVKQIMKARGAKEKGKFPPREAYDIIRQICDALVYARRMNVVHRDIKPDNIMVASGAEQQRDVAKLCDLGLAKQVETEEDSGMTQSGVAVGTPHYISPEQAKGEKTVDYRSDMYSLGATFYHMLVGRTPFEGQTSASVMALHISSQAMNPCDLDNSIPLGYGQIISRLMAKSPADRYDSPESLIEDLEAAQRGKPPAKAVNFKGKSSCLMPSVASVHKGGRARTTGPHAAVATARQTTQVTTPLKSPPVRPAPRHASALLMAAGAVGALVLLALALNTGGSSNNAHQQQASNDTQKQSGARPQLHGQAADRTQQAKLEMAKPGPEKVEPKPEKPEPAKPVQPAPPPAKPEPAPTPAPIEPVRAQPPAPVVPIPAKIPAKEEPPKPEPATEPAAEKKAPQPGPEADAAYCRFLREVMNRTAKMDLAKAEVELKELAKQPEYAAASADIGMELKDIAAAIVFEQDALKRIGSSGMTLKLPPEIARRYPASEGKIKSFDPARGLEMEVTGAGFFVPPSAVSLDDILANASDPATLSRLRYVAARGAPSRGREWLPNLKGEVEQRRWERKLRLMDAQESEILAQALLNKMQKAAEAKNWKAFNLAIEEFGKSYADSAVAKENDKRIKEWKLAALQALGTGKSADVAAAPEFHASAVKALPDGFIDVTYEFDKPEQLQDFVCSNGQLSAEDGSLVLPPGRSSYTLAQHKFGIDELRSLKVVGRGTDRRGWFRQLRLVFMQPDARPENEMQLLARERDSKVMIRNMGPWVDKSMDLRLDGDTEISAEAQDGHLAWSINGNAIANTPATPLGGRHLAFGTSGGLASFTSLHIVFKPAVVAVIPSGFAPGLKGEVYAFTEDIRKLPQIPPGMKPVDHRTDANLDFALNRQLMPDGMPVENIYIRWTGLLKVDNPGKFTLGLRSDDGSRLVVNGKQVVEMNGIQSMRASSGEVELKKGLNEINVEFFNCRGGWGIQLLWQGTNGLEPIPSSMLFHRE